MNKILLTIACVFTMSTATAKPEYKLELLNSSEIAWTDLHKGDFSDGGLVVANKIAERHNDGSRNNQSNNFTYMPPPANDTCAGAIDLDMETSPVSGTTISANNDSVVDCLYNINAPDVFYSITVPNTFTFDFAQTFNDYDSTVRVAYGVTCPGDVLINCNDDDDYDPVNWTNTTGASQKVYITISAFATGSGSFNFMYDVSAPGTSCSSSTAVTDGLYNTTIIDASGGIGDNDQGGDAAWFVYTPTLDGSMQISSCQGGSDTSLAVFADCADFDSDFPYDNVVAYNDDFCDLGNGDNYASSLVIDVIAGEDYYIRFDDLWEDGTFDWTLTYTPPDNCPSQIAVTDGSYITTIIDASGGIGDDGQGGDAAWYVYTPTLDGSLIINACQGGSDTSLAVFADCEDFDSDFPYDNVLVYNDDFCDQGNSDPYASLVVFDVLAGEDYYIRWDDLWEDGEDFTFDWSINLTPTCPGGSTTYFGGTWSNGFPDATKQAIISDFLSIAPSTFLEACAITVTENGLLFNDAYVASFNNITNNGIIDVTNNGTIVQTNDASLATNNGDIYIGTISPMLDSRDFQILGSPMTGEIREGVWGNGYNVQDYTPENFIPNMLVTATYNFADDNLDDWNELVTGALTPGAGYLVFPQNSYNGAGGQFFYHYNMGTLNNGVITQPLNYNGTQEGSPNMLSNPYASGLNTALFIDANPEIDAVYFWEHGDAPMAGVPGPNGAGPNYNNEDVSVHNMTGGVQAASGAGDTPGSIMAVSQGFGVFANAAGTATFNNSMRVVANGVLRTAEEDKNSVWLHIENTEFNLGANTLVGFTDAATAGYDRMYDNYKLSTAVSIFSHMDGDLETGFSIQSREAFDVAMQIPMGFASQINTASTYSVSLSDFDGDAMADTTIYLVDNVVGTVTNLNEGDYGFTSEMGTFNNRFTLQFVDRNVLANNEANLNAVVLSPNPTDGLVNIVSPRALVQNVVVTDIQGRVVNTISIDGLNTYQLDMSSLGSAMYFVQVTTDAGSITKRMIKK